MIRPSPPNRVLIYLFLFLSSLTILSADPANWARVVHNTLIHEGGSRYTNHPQDPGGPTKYGVTIHDVRKYLDPNATADTVRALTEQQALSIYQQHYWTAIRGDEL